MKEIKVGDTVLSCLFHYGQGVTLTRVIYSKVTQINDARNITVEFELYGKADWVTIRKSTVRKSGTCEDCVHRLRHLLTGGCDGKYKKLRKK